ncbi:MAG TPA: hypothetical protein VIQ99_05440, partial [Gammaproteobacteria bacterium]
MDRSNRLGALVRPVQLFAVTLLLGGCSFLMTPQKAEGPPAQAAVPNDPDPAAPRLAPLDTRHFELAPGQEVIGATQVIFARHENTFSTIGREYNLGYEELRRANPGVDQWLPGEGTPLYLPTQTILPDAPHSGI